jgi:hypothetical protein
MRLRMRMRMRIAPDRSAGALKESCAAAKPGDNAVWPVSWSANREYL